MRSPSILVVDVVIDRPLQVLVTEYQAMINAFVADASYPAFCDCIGLWCFCRRTDLPDFQRADTSIECGTEAAITVVDQEFGRLR